MNRFGSKQLLVWLLAAVSLVVLPWHAPSRSPDNFGEPQISRVKGAVKVLPRVEVVNFDNVVYRGRMDINPTLDRIRAGNSLDHPNDGAIFLNRERRLPVKSNRNYYREFVHWPRPPIKGVRFPGPQRVIIGLGGEVYYTGDHYSSFTRVPQ
jgi:filamentous hemagglutinin